MARLDLHGITRSFGETPVLRGVDLSIADGEFLAVLGPSGCGKSTLLRIIAGLEAQDDGQVLIDCRGVDHLPPKTRDVAVVFQSYALYPHMSVAQNLSLPLVMRDLRRAQRLPFARLVSPRVRETRNRIREAVEQAAALVEIASLLDRKPAQLSGGQRQRVALARALVRQPKLFLLDEPLSNLDATLRTTTRSEIVALQRRLATTTVYVTHDQTEAMTMADRIAIMIDGRILQVGSAREIYDRPADLRAALFIGSPKMNVFDATADGGLLRIEGNSAPLGTLSHSFAGSLRVGVRPEHVELAVADGDALLRATIRHAEFLGSEAFVHFAVTGTDPARTGIARVDSDAIDAMRTAGSVGVNLRTDRLHFFDERGVRIELTCQGRRGSVAARHQLAGA